MNLPNLSTATKCSDADAASLFASPSNSGWGGLEQYAGGTACPCYVPYTSAALPHGTGEGWHVVQHHSRDEAGQLLSLCSDCWITYSNRYRLNSKTDL